MSEAAESYLAQARQKAGQIPFLPQRTAAGTIERIGIVGAGTMGSGIAMACLNAGFAVTLVETGQPALDRGLATMRRAYDSAVAKGRLPAERAVERLARVSPTLDMNALADADLIIEAAFEDLALKQQIFARLDRIARAGAILATNTSFLDIDAIATAVHRPEGLIGLHFFSPAHVMRLVEVVRRRSTPDSVIAVAMDVARRLDKVAVLSGVCDGFIANRLMAPRGAEAETMMLEGTSIAVIDRALVEYGFAVGHFQMMDMVGLDVVGRNAAQRTVMGELVAAGRLGLKSGAGYYDYDAERRPVPSPVTDAIIADVAAAQGIAASGENSDAILDRLLLPVVNEGARILEEGIALRASDIDVAAVLGYNWPAWHGGPMFWAERRGLPVVVERLRAMADRHGERFMPARLLAELAERGEGFGGAGS